MLLTDFTAAIHRPMNGFRWVRRNDLVLVADGQGTEYDPLVEAPGLFLDFAKLQPEEAPVLAFADRYGDLLQCGPTTLGFWAQSIERLSYGVGLWQAITAYKASGRKDASVLRPYIRWQAGEISAASWLVLRQRSYQKGELWQAANDVLFYLFNAQLEPLFENQPDRQVATFSILPHAEHFADATVRIKNLVDVMWLQFFFSIRGDKRFDQCKECGRSFERRGKRTDRLFCSDACRVRAHRQRWQKVAELHRLGKGPKTISTEVGIPMKAVKEWLKEHQ